MCPAICRTLSDEGKILLCHLPVSQQRLLDQTSQWLLIIQEWVGIWEPECKLGDLSLLKTDNQAPSVKRSLIQKGRVQG